MLMNLHYVKHLLLFSTILINLQHAHKFKAGVQEVSNSYEFNVLKNGMEDDMLH